jgi:hypothetical protein
MSAETIAKIRAELFRLHARVEDVGRDGIEVADRGHGNVVLSCRGGRELDWFGSAEDALARLSGLPDAEGKSGPELVRSEFAGARREPS